MTVFFFDGGNVALLPHRLAPDLLAVGGYEHDALHNARDFLRLAFPREFDTVH